MNSTNSSDVPMFNKTPARRWTLFGKYNFFIVMPDQCF
jgi:hypothetical protein